MFRRISRWSWLTFFALSNLACWVGVAVAVGLAASPKLNLGVEALVRESQATAVSLWNQAGTAAAGPVGKPTSAGKPVPLAPTEGAAVEPPTAAVVWPDTPTPEPAARPPNGQAAAGATAPTSPPASTTAGPTPAATPVRRPLLLANPGFKDLAQMDAEMARSAQGRPVQIRYSEADLNRQIAALVDNNPKVPYENIDLDLGRDRVVLTGSATVLGSPLKAQVEGKVTVKDCHARLEIERIDIAGVMTPSFVRDQIEAMVAEALAWYPPDYPLCLEQIILEEGRATVYGHRR